MPQFRHFAEHPTDDLQWSGTQHGMSPSFELATGAACATLTCGAAAGTSASAIAISAASSMRKCAIGRLSEDARRTSMATPRHVVGPYALRAARLDLCKCRDVRNWHLDGVLGRRCCGYAQ